METANELKNKKILVIDDNSAVLEIIRASLEKRGAIVYTAENGEKGLRKLDQHEPDLVVLDIAMPVMDGWETCRYIRAKTEIPIIMLTAMVEENDVVSGLNLGAVDYITKPFSTRILRARIKSAIRQANTTAESVTTKERVYSDPYLSIDLNKRLVTVEGTAVHLSKTEFALLKYMFLHGEQPLPYQELVDNIWGENYPDGIKNLYVYVSQLRQKIEKNSSEPEYILTEYGTGYRFNKKKGFFQS